MELRLNHPFRIGRDSGGHLITKSCVYLCMASRRPRGTAVTSFRRSSGCLSRVCWIAFLVVALFTSSFCQRQDTEDGPLDPSLPEGVTVRDITSRFAAQEQTFKQ